MTEKEKIDYEIKAKAAQRDKELGEWIAAFWVAILFFTGIFTFISLI